MTLKEKSTVHEKVMDKATMLYYNENLGWLDAARQAIKEYKPLINTYVAPKMNDEEDVSSEEQ